MVSGIAYLYNLGKIVNPFTVQTPIIPITNTTLLSKPKSCSDAASVGNRTYAMTSPYIYIETEESAGVKFFSISKEGIWSDVQCVLRENKYYLEGQEQTTHMVFYAENNKELTYFGTSTNNTESSISFNSQGIASLRTFTKPKDYTVKTTCENTICQKDIVKKQELEKKYSRLVEEKHKAGLNDYCKASILYGKDFDKSESSIYVVSICKNYTRVMRGSFSE
ncbi:hypothetical protein [uncultured Thiothrix sp.]|uniref:hypothetical protein n=1 Tax=uncultured Thiothrix sp. TaxID=223185 RepID=UPI00261A07DD|nr:hypothetical protein [uncultured Thiothrix sp.]